MKKIGWAGLGHMGLPMAKNLSKAGYDVKVWNRTLEKAKESGLPYVEDVEQLLDDREVIITMLFGSESVKEVYKKIFSSGRDISGKTFIDMTTIHPETAKEIAEELLKRKADFLEAPVIGSVIPAKKGLLTIVVSGDEEVYNRHSDIFNILGKEIFFLGDYGAASTLKLVNNTVLGNILATICEAIIFAEKAGINRETTLKILHENYETHFSVNLIHKDLSYALDLSQKKQNSLIITAVSRELYNSAKANRLGELDFVAILEVYKKLSGIS